MSLPVCDADKFLLGFVCEKGHLDVAKWLVSEFEDDDGWAVGSYAFLYACQKGHLPTVQWLVSKFEISSANVKFSLTGTYDHVHIVQWLISTFRLTIDDVRNREYLKTVLRSAATRPQLAQYLVTEFNLTTEDAQMEMTKMDPGMWTRTCETLDFKEQSL